jgi:hypothetical protein
LAKLYSHINYVLKRPWDIAPLLFAKTMRKKRTVCSAMEDNNWVRDLNLRNGLTTELLTEFVALWNLVATTGPLQDQEESRGHD